MSNLSALGEYIDNLYTDDDITKLAKSKDINKLIDAAVGVFAPEGTNFDNFICGVILGNTLKASGGRRILWEIDIWDEGMFYFCGSRTNVINKIKALPDK